MTDEQDDQVPKEDVPQTTGFTVRNITPGHEDDRDTGYKNLDGALERGKGSEPREFQGTDDDTNTLNTAAEERNRQRDIYDQRVRNLKWKTPQAVVDRMNQQIGVDYTYDPRSKRNIRTETPEQKKTLEQEIETDKEVKRQERKDRQPKRDITPQKADIYSRLSGIPSDRMGEAPLYLQRFIKVNNLSDGELAVTQKVNVANDLLDNLKLDDDTRNGIRRSMNRYVFNSVVNHLLRDNELTREDKEAIARAIISSPKVPSFYEARNAYKTKVGEEAKTREFNKEVYDRVRRLTNLDNRKNADARWNESLRHVGEDGEVSGTPTMRDKSRAYTLYKDYADALRHIDKYLEQNGRTLDDLPDDGTTKEMYDRYVERLKGLEKVMTSGGTTISDIIGWNESNKTRNVMGKRVETPMFEDSQATGQWESLMSSIPSDFKNPKNQQDYLKLEDRVRRHLEGLKGPDGRVPSYYNELKDALDRYLESRRVDTIPRNRGSKSTGTNTLSTELKRTMDKYQSVNKKGEKVFDPAKLVVDRDAIIPVVDGLKKLYEDTNGRGKTRESIMTLKESIDKACKDEYGVNASDMRMLLVPNYFETMVKGVNIISDVDELNKLRTKSNEVWTMLRKPEDKKRIDELIDIIDRRIEQLQTSING